jgi:hypothetical protein
VFAGHAKENRKSPQPEEEFLVNIQFVRTEGKIICAIHMYEFPTIFISSLY